MRMLILAGALALAGCTTTGSLDESDAAKLAKACSNARAAHAGFILADAFQFLPEKVMKAEKAAWAVAEPICANPSAFNASIALAAVADALDEINAALAETEE